MSLENEIKKLTAAVEANTAAVLGKGSAPAPVEASLPAAQIAAAPRTETAPVADPLAGIGAAPAGAIDVLGPTVAPAPLPEVSRADAIDLAQQVGAQKGRAVLIELFAKFGADSFPKIKAADYAAFADAAKAVLK